MSTQALKKAVKETLLIYHGKPKNSFYFDMTVDLVTRIIAVKSAEEARQILDNDVASAIDDEAMRDDLLTDLMHIKEQYENRQLGQKAGGKIRNPYTGRYIQRGGRLARKLGI